MMGQRRVGKRGKLEMWFRSLWSTQLVTSRLLARLQADIFTEDIHKLEHISRLDIRIKSFGQRL